MDLARKQRLAAYTSLTDCVYWTVRIESLNIRLDSFPFATRSVVTAVVQDYVEQYIIYRRKRGHGYQEGWKSRPTFSHKVALTVTQFLKC